MGSNPTPTALGEIPADPPEAENPVDQEWSREFSPLRVTTRRVGIPPPTACWEEHGVTPSVPYQCGKVSGSASKTASAAGGKSRARTPVR